MLERGKMERDVIEIVGIDSLVPQDHLRSSAAENRSSGGFQPAV